MKAKEAWTKLLKIYPFTKPSNELFTEFCRAIDRFESDIIASAYTHTVENELRFPTVALFRAYCFEFQDRAEAERHKIQMENDKRTAEAIFHKPGYGKDEYSRACFLNIRTALSGKVTIKEFIENSKILHINISPFIQWCDDWNIDQDNILGAAYMHDFEGTKGFKVEKQGHRVIA